MSAQRAAVGDAGGDDGDDRTCKCCAASCQARRARARVATAAAHARALAVPLRDVDALASCESLDDETADDAAQRSEPFRFWRLRASFLDMRSHDELLVDDRDLGYTDYWCAVVGYGGVQRRGLAAGLRAAATTTGTTRLTNSFRLADFWCATGIAHLPVLADV